MKCVHFTKQIFDLKCALVFVACILTYVLCHEANNEVLDTLNPDLLNGRADIVFLLDRSGSVGAANFEIMKGFVESLLTHVVVDANATRVAVISYSNQPTLHLNYIEDPKTKCFLSQEMQNVVYKDSEATNIASALELARLVLMKARPNVNKVAILISDGMATMGGDPVPAARRLKDDTGTKIFAFGIGKFLKSQLRAMATTSKHVYICPGFKEFKRLARKIRGDPHEKTWSSDTDIPNCDHLCDSPYKGELHDPGCCDHHGSCSCALLSGMHTCVCQPGHFGLSGTWGKCRPCPRGTYKSNLEPARFCMPCPLGSTTSQEASTSLSDCYCVDGYVGDPSAKIECSRVICPPLQNPSNGFIAGYCDNSYESECYFICDVNYELVDYRNGHRICEANGKWSGSMPTCQKTRCEYPVVPAGGYVECDKELFVGNKCIFQCYQGYHLSGAKERKCLATKRWSGSESTCLAILCPKPNNLPHGKIHGCRSYQYLKYDEQCVFRCNTGFQLVGSYAITCGINGKYIDPYSNRPTTLPACNDVTKPEIFCPQSKVLQTLERQNFAYAHWEVPIATDNSGDEVLVTRETSYEKKFGIGEHLIRYKATDSSSLTSYCEFTITVRDKEEPQVLSCPSTIIVNTTDEIIEVFWEIPQFKDNSDGRIEIERNYEPGDLFTTGSHNVEYRATDASQNSAYCKFQVIVHQNGCPYHPPPINGAFVCEDWMYGQFCQTHCNFKYDFVTKPADWYICNSEAEWVTMPENFPIPWPDCSRRAMPYRIRQMLQGFYFSGDCNDPKVQDAIKRSFLYYFRAKFSDQYCKSEGACTPDMVAVTCGEVVNYLGRKKREISSDESKNTLFVQIDFPIENTTITESFYEDLLNLLDNFDWDVHHELKEEFDALKLNDSFEMHRAVQITSKEIVIICANGSVLQNHECSMCLPGFYHDLIKDECLCCPSGTYQDEEGQIQCNKCPVGFDTENACSNNITECRGVCTEGTFSTSGLETCISCPIGTYQNESRQDTCFKCHEAYTTYNVGSRSKQDCRRPCDIGTSSETGLEPCSACPVGYYQDLKGQNTCLECSNNFTTLRIGSNSSGCVDYNPCNDGTVCKNRGKCTVVKHEVQCECPVGFSEEHCEDDINECLHTPCLNNGQCENTPGSFVCKCANDFTGHLCEEQLEVCDAHPCLNDGICVAQVDGYQCICDVNYAGKNCEIFQEICYNDTSCQNGGLCVESGLVSKECVCLVGFAGEDCSVPIDQCESIICLNSGSCTTEYGVSECICPDGYIGELCETNIDECIANKCNKGSCVDLIASYKCVCGSGWSGRYCENELSSDFVLEFPQNPTLDDMACSTVSSPLTEVTISMWIQTNHVPGLSSTPFSYAAFANETSEHDIKLLDNALAISDCSGLTFYVNNEPIVTDVSVDDGIWHHLVFTWSSMKSGQWKVYKDGKAAANGQNLQESATVPGHGYLVIGQEQDEMNGSFSPMESFTGNISRVNVWNSYFSLPNVTQLYNFEENIPAGKMIAWSDFLGDIKGNVRVIRDFVPLIRSSE